MKLNLSVSMWNFIHYFPLRKGGTSFAFDRGLDSLEAAVGEVAAAGYGMELWPHWTSWEWTSPEREALVSRSYDLYAEEHRPRLAAILRGVRSSWHTDGDNTLEGYRRKIDTVGQAAYMKAYDPAFVMAKQEIEGMDFKFIQANHLHPSNYLHLDHFNVQHVGTLPPEAVESGRVARQQSFAQAFGPLCQQAESVWGITYGLIHDLYSLRNMVGVPTGVKSVEIWKDNRAITVVLEYPNDARCVLNRVDLETLWDFRQTLEVYGDDKRVLLNYPTGFSRRVLSTLQVQGIDAQGTSYRKEPAIPWESAFTAELRHFHACITEGATCRTPITEARHDVQLIIDITRSYLSGEPVRGAQDGL